MEELLLKGRQVLEHTITNVIIAHRYYRDGLVSKDQRIAFALKQIRGQTIVQPRFYGGATLRRSRQVRRAESFNAECGIQENSEGEWVCGWDADDNGLHRPSL